MKHCNPRLYGIEKKNIVRAYMSLLVGDFVQLYEQGLVYLTLYFALLLWRFYGVINL